MSHVAPRIDVQDACPGASDVPASDGARRHLDVVAALPDPVDVALGRVRDELTALVDERRRWAARQGAACARMWADFGGAVGGKLVRPRLLTLSYLGCGGTELDLVVGPGVAVELLHTAMLVHDDLLDHDELRRGRLNVAGAARARMLGGPHPAQVVDQQVSAAALLAGDLGIAAAFRVLATSGLPATVAAELVDLVGEAVEATVAGELLDVGSELLEPGEVDALAVAELKTAWYSTRLPLLAGAVLAGAPGAVRVALERVGVAIGVAYQLVDDLLGVFGDPAVTGKSVLSDLRDGKRTLLLRYAYEHADARARLVLRHHVGRPDLDEQGAAQVRAVLRDTGAVGLVEARVDALVATARELAAARLPEPLARALGEEAVALTGRSS